MLTLTRKPLRYTIAALCLLAGISSAQANLKITFEEDTANGLLQIRFSGETIAPFGIQNDWNSNSATFDANNLYFVSNGDGTSKYYGSANGWVLQDPLPWSSGYSSPMLLSGAGGFHHNAGTAFLQLFVSSSTPTGNTLSWDGALDYAGTLAGIGLNEGDSGNIIFTKDADTLTIEWAVLPAVPEPATYALVLGLGVAGVAMLRRRARS